MNATILVMSDHTGSSVPLVWHEEQGRFIWESPNFQVSVEKADPAKNEGLRIEFAVPPIEPIRLTLGSVVYTAAGAGKPMSTLPQPAGFFCQQPFLVVSQEITSAFGLRMVTQILGEEHGATVDIRLETVASLDNVELDGILELRQWRGNPIEAPGWMDLRCDTTPQCSAVLTDLGAAGRIEPLSQDRSALRINWFRQSLEKGVILVGRLAWVYDPEAGDHRTIQDRHGDWLDRPTFL